MKNNNFKFAIQSPLPIETVIDRLTLATNGTAWLTYPITASDDYTFFGHVSPDSAELTIVPFPRRTLQLSVTLDLPKMKAARA